MSKLTQDDHRLKFHSLREEAEKRLALAATEKQEDKLIITADLFHELQIHQIELEMQNEELRRAHIALEASRDLYVDLYEFAPVAYLTLNTDGMITEINLAGEKLLGINRSKLVHRRFARFVATQDKDRWYRLFLRIKSGLNYLAKEEQSFDLLLKCNNEEMIHARLDCVRKVNSHGALALRIALIDITLLKLAEAELRIAATTFESQEGIFITDAHSVILKVNQTFSHITGYSADEAIGHTPRLMKSGVQDAFFYETLWHKLKENGVWQGEIWNQRKSGEIFPQWMIISAVLNSDSIVTNYVATFTDTSTQKAASNQIEQLAFYDPLTNLPNRRLLLDRLKQIMISSARNNQNGALMFIDLDNFKMLNDTRGHDVGDLLLQQVAQRLISCIRDNDTVARLGGDEFVVMLETLSDNANDALNHAKMVGGKILSVLSTPYVLAGHDYRCTSSIGATMFRNNIISAEELLKHVDIAMYQAKRKGRNNLCFFDRAMQALVTARATMETELCCAIKEGQFRLYYQSQNDHDGQVFGAEALIRWQHPTKGLITPNEFIPLAEESGLILPIGEWVLESACAQLKLWQNSPLTKHLQLAINISAKQFYKPNFVEELLAIVKRTDIDPDYLKLEITESLVLDDIDDAILRMKLLQNAGLNFSMDDFGTGYSSLAYLTQLPFSQIKIDRSFINNIGVKSSDNVIVQTIIGMGTTLGISVIAEGVETEAQRAFLELHGCPFCQGYLFSKPMPVDEFMLLLKTKGSIN